MHNIKLKYEDKEYRINFVVGYYTEDVVGEHVLDISVQSPDYEQHLAVDTLNMPVYAVSCLQEAEELFTDTEEVVDVSIRNKRYIYVRPFRFDDLRLLWSMHSDKMYILAIETAGSYTNLAYESEFVSLPVLPEKELIRNGEFEF